MVGSVLLAFGIAGGNVILVAAALPFAVLAAVGLDAADKAAIEKAEEAASATPAPTLSKPAAAAPAAGATPAPSPTPEPAPAPAPEAAPEAAAATEAPTATEPAAAPAPDAAAAPVADADAVSTAPAEAPAEPVSAEPSTPSGPPIEGYDLLPANDVFTIVDGIDDPELLGRFRDYELANRGRRGIIFRVTRRLAAVGAPVEETADAPGASTEGAASADLADAVPSHDDPPADEAEPPSAAAADAEEPAPEPADAVVTEAPAEPAPAPLDESADATPAPAEEPAAGEEATVDGAPAGPEAPAGDAAPAETPAEGSEPTPGYDGLSVSEVMSALETMDAAGIAAVRAYETDNRARRTILFGCSRRLDSLSRG